MRVGIKAKQVLGVTTIVGIVVVVLSVIHLATLTRVSLEESRARGELLANAIYQRAREVVVSGADPYVALQGDPGLRSILESAFYDKAVTYAAITDVHGVAVVAADAARQGQPLAAGGDLNAMLARPALAELAAIYSGQGRNLELRQRLLLGDTEFGSIHIGVSTLLIRSALDLSLRPAVVTAFIALGTSVGVAMLLAQLLLRPIHVIRSGLTRLGRGEFGVRLDLNQDDEFGELGTFFNAVSAQLSADRSQITGHMANLESAVAHLEDAVAIVSPSGELLFLNPAMNGLLPEAAVGASLDRLLAPDHPLRSLVEQTRLSRQSRGPVSAALAEKTGDPSERLMMTHAVTDSSGALLAVMVIVRDLSYLGQVQSTIRYSRKLAALGRLSAGVAHEVKNPLNAMMIHLELLRQQLAPAPASALAAAGRRGTASVASEAGSSATLAHVDVIAGEIRRLDEVVQGFLKFSRPEYFTLQPVSIKALLDDLATIIGPEAARARVAVAVECSAVADVNGDPAMLQQAFRNLALNACQAMPEGGSLTIRAEDVRDRRVAISFIDTGVGIRPEHLDRIFDLYFTTKTKGSGIGLSMVYRTVQMHDGEIEVQSVPGVGTTFRVLLPQA